MRLWTIQPEEVWDILREKGVYRCDPDKCELLKIDELNPKFGPAYNWLVNQMEKRIGKRPDGIVFPVWAWYRYAGKNRVDLRRERWAYGTAGQRMACIEIEIPDEQVLLSDFGEWHYVLNRWPISQTEEESKQIDEFVEHADKDTLSAFLNVNWEQIFDITPVKNGWRSRGDDIQATFWELKQENLKGVRFFTTAQSKHEI